MEPTGGCDARLLARGRTCRVEACSHGVVHLTLGALTLRVSTEQLGDLAATLTRAVGNTASSHPATPAERWLC